MNATLRNLLILIVLVAAALGVYSLMQPQSAYQQPPAGTNSTPEQESVEALVQTGNEDGNCLPDADWFPQSQTQRTDDSAFKSVSNCVFHKWAWQNFLWLTQDVDGQPRFLSMASPESLLGMQRDGMAPRTMKADASVPFNEIAQAGPGH